MAKRVQMPRESSIGKPIGPTEAIEACDFLPPSFTLSVPGDEEENEIKKFIIQIWHGDSKIGYWADTNLGFPSDRERTIARAEEINQSGRYAARVLGVIYSPPIKPMAEFEHRRCTLANVQILEEIIHCYWIHTGEYQASQLTSEERVVVDELVARLGEEKEKELHS